MAKKAIMEKEYDIKIPDEWFNPAFHPYLWKIFNYEIYWGGRGSGKSVFICQKLVMQLSTTEGRNLVILRKQATDCRNSCFAEMYKVIYQFKLQDIWDIRENPDMRMYNKVTKSEIVFTGMDKADNVKSITFKNGNATDLWYEETTEENLEDTITTLDDSIRAYDIKCRLILSFNPPLNTFWLVLWLKSYFKVNTIECTQTGIIETIVQGHPVVSDYLIHHSTYKDNKWNFRLKTDGTADYSKPNQYAAKLERLKNTNPYRYRIDCLGLTGTAGHSVFDSNKIAERMSELEEQYRKNPPYHINFSYELDDKDVPIIETITHNISIDGETTIYIAPNPKHPYVAALDTAGEGADFFAMPVFDNITDEQVAVFRSQRPVNECMLQVYGLLKMYNDALIAPEVNFSEYPIEKLKEWHYTKIYQRERPKDSYSDGYEQKLGFRTTVGNRQSIIDNLIEWSDTNIGKINDYETLSEMLSFTRQSKKNKGTFMGAEMGAHDDLVIALAILLKAKEQQSCEEQAEIKELKGFYFPEQLDMMVKQGTLSKSLASRYAKEQQKKPNSFFKDRKVLNNRYARH
jgi:phage terminase large subunit